MYEYVRMDILGNTCLPFFTLNSFTFVEVLRTINVCAKGCVVWSYVRNETAFNAELL
jgi:hypothetical protein